MFQEYLLKLNMVLQIEGQDNLLQRSTERLKNNSIYKLQMFPKREQIQQQSFQLQKRYNHYQNKKNGKTMYSYAVCILVIVKIKKWIKKHRHRDRVLDEWLRTERSYNFDLNIAIDFIKKPMQLIKNVTKQQIQLLFPEVQPMIKLSDKMISVLQTAVTIKNQYKSLLGNDINQFVSSYKIYGNYFVTHAKRIQILNDLLESSEPQLKQIEINMQAEYTRKNSKKQGMTIKDVMDQPHNRLFKYVLLLKQYIKKLPKDHRDYQNSTKCLNLFHEINNYNNDLIKKVEQKEKKQRLIRIFGQKMNYSGQYVNQLLAKTIYNDVKIYIFQNLIAVSIVLENLGSQKQEKLGSFQISQFCYVSGQPDIKYFKNIALFISKQSCIHFFFSEAEIKVQFIKIVEDLIRQSRNFRQNQSRRSQKYISSIPSSLSKRTSQTSSLSSSKQIKYALLEPELRIQVLGFDVRSFGTLNHNTQFIIRFMIPHYFEDEINFLEEPEKVLKKELAFNQSFRGHSSYSTNPSIQSTDSQKGTKKSQIYCLNQRIQMSYNMVEQLFLHMRSLSITKLPEIDPQSREISASSSKGKKKTMSFEVRKFLVEQFFNTAFRSQTVLATPMWFLSKMKINLQMWSYIITRNAQIRQNREMSWRSYDYDHCSFCKYGNIKSVEQFEKTRILFNSDTLVKSNLNQPGCCFNLLNLVKTRLLSFNLSQFDTLERILMYYHYMQGRLDYPFISHRRTQKHMKLIKVYLASVENNYIEIIIDSKTTVGQGLQQIGKYLQIDCVFDFDLIMIYNEKTRILDRDENLADLVKAIGIHFQECSVKNNVIKKKSSFFSALRQLSNHILQPSSPQNKIILLKTVYLTKSLQMKSLMTYPEKMQLEIEKIFWTIRKGIIRISVNQFIEQVSLLYCLKQYQNLLKSETFRASSGLIQMVMPDQFMHIYHYRPEFKRDIASAIQRERNYMRSKYYSKNNLYNRLINFALDKPGFRTYFIQVQPKQISVNLIQITQLPQNCLLGVNLKNLVVCRNQQNSSVLISLPLSEIEYEVTVFSIYIYYETQTLRFDGKMLYQFGEIIRKYQTILAKFPQYLC